MYKVFIFTSLVIQLSNCYAYLGTDNCPTKKREAFESKAFVLSSCAVYTNENNCNLAILNLLRVEENFPNRCK